MLNQLANLMAQTVTVPLYLAFWGVELYGEWLILAALPAYLALSDIGFTTAANHDMTISAARGDLDAARRVFQSCAFLVFCLVTMIGVLIVGLVAAIGLHDLLGLERISAGDTSFVVLALGAQVLTNQYTGLLYAGYTAGGEYGRGASFMAGILLAEQCLAPAVALAAGGSPAVVAASICATRIIGVVTMAADLLRRMTWLVRPRGQGTVVVARALLRPAVGFAAFPAGNAFNQQGTVLAVGAALGPASVVVFSTTRTLTRLALQMVRVIPATVGPEISRAFGRGEVSLLRDIHRASFRAALWVATLVSASVFVLGGPLLDLWTHGELDTDMGLLAMLLAVAVIDALWLSSLTILYATNRHATIGARYVATSVVAALVIYPAAIWLGIEGAALALILLEVAMVSYVLPRVLIAVEDHPRPFLRQMAHPPDPRRPLASRQARDASS